MKQIPSIDKSILSAVFSLFFLLTGCISESDDSKTRGSNGEEEIRFRDSGPITLFVDDYFNNPLEIENQSEIEFLSSDVEIATVSKLGEVKAVGVGSATITAFVESKADVYSYQVDVISTEVTLTARMGSSKTELLLQNHMIGAELMSSDERDCRFKYLVDCDYKDTKTVDDRLISINSIGLKRSGRISLSMGGKTAESIISPARKSAAGQVVEFNGRLWMVMPRTSTVSGNSEVWSSSDAQNWELEVYSPPFSPRSGFKLVVHDSQMWVVGGLDESGKRNDVWTSEDGTVWTQVVEAAAFSNRYHHEVVSFRGKLWLIGGLGGDGNVPDGEIWSSTDGADWSLVGNIPRRFNHRAIVHQGQLVVVGGTNGISLFKQTRLNDVWSTFNGSEWNQLNASAAFSKRFGHELYVHDGLLYLIGGNTEDFQITLPNEIWSTHDAITWEKVTESSDFKSYSFFQVIEFENKIWRFGGGDWVSEDGQNWTDVNESAGEFSLLNSRAVSFNNKLWSLEGSSNHIWSSIDGFEWDATSTIEAMTPRWGATMFVHENKLWLIGGKDLLGEPLYDLWMSDDGISWQEINSKATEFVDDYKVVSHNDRIYLIGGKELAGNQTSQVWSSTDGKTWRQDQESAAFSPRSEFSVESFLGQLWLIGGYDDKELAEVWASLDGREWTLKNQNPEFGALSNFGLTVLGNRLLLNDQGKQWISFDGINWSIFEDAAAYPSWTRDEFIKHSGLLMLIEDNFGSFWTSESGKDWKFNKRVNLSFD